METTGFVTADRVAEHLGLHVITVYAWAEEGRIPSFKIGRNRRFRLNEIEDWVMRQSHSKFVQRRRRALGQKRNRRVTV